MGLPGSKETALSPRCRYSDIHMPLLWHVEEADGKKLFTAGTGRMISKAFTSAVKETRR